MVKLHEELHEAAMLLSEINEHSLIVVDTDGRTTEIRPSPVEALMMMMIVYETDVPTDDIIKGNETAIMSEIGNLMDLEQVVSRCTTSTTSTASTVKASSVEVNIFEPAIPMAKLYADLRAAQAMNESKRPFVRTSRTSVASSA
jgi:hypothetical protein